MSESAPNTIPPNIVLIEDDPAIRRFVRIALAASGMSVFEADNAARPD